MDFSKLLGSVGGLSGVQALISRAGGMVAIQKKLAGLGISPTALQEFVQEAQAVLADGKVGAADFKTVLAPIAQKKGIPPQVLDAVVAVLQQKAK